MIAGKTPFGYAAAREARGLVQRQPEAAAGIDEFEQGLQRVVVIGHRALEPQAVGTETALELIVIAAAHGEDFLHERGVGAHGGDREQAGVVPSLVIDRVLVEREQRLGGEAEKIAFDKIAVGGGPRARVAGEVIGFGKTNDADGLVEALHVAASAPAREESAHAPAVEARGIRGILVRERDENAAHFRRVTIIAGMQISPAQALRGAFARVMQLAAIRGDNAFVGEKFFASGALMFGRAVGAQRRAIRGAGVIKNPAAVACGEFHGFGEQRVGVLERGGAGLGEVGRGAKFREFRGADGETRGRREDGSRRGGAGGGEREEGEESN